MKIRNKTDSVQAVTNIPEFAAGEVRDVDEATAELLLRSPFIFEKAGSSLKGVEKNTSKSRPVLGVEPN